MSLNPCWDDCLRWAAQGAVPIFIPNLDPDDPEDLHGLAWRPSEGDLQAIHSGDPYERVAFAAVLCMQAYADCDIQEP